MAVELRRLFSKGSDIDDVVADVMRVAGYDLERGDVG
jgi:hypothetical protein